MQYSAIGTQHDQHKTSEQISFGISAHLFYNIAATIDVRPRQIILLLGGSATC